MSYTQQQRICGAEATQVCVRKPGHDGWCSYSQQWKYSTANQGTPVEPLSRQTEDELRAEISRINKDRDRLYARLAIAQSELAYLRRQQEAVG